MLWVRPGIKKEKKKKTVDTDKYRFKILKASNTDYKEIILGILETKGKSQNIFKIYRKKRKL